MSSLIRRLVEVALRVPAPLRWVAVVAWAAMIFLASNQPGLAVSDDPGVDLPVRHVAHIVVYAGLTLLITWALAGGRYPSTRTAIAAALAALAYGVTDEWHQTMVPTRSGRPEDLLWDAIGAAVAVTLIVVIRTAIERDASSQSGADPGRSGRT